jgi:hypothetical protein
MTSIGDGVTSGDEHVTRHNDALTSGDANARTVKFAVFLLVNGVVDRRLITVCGDGSD